MNLDIASEYLTMAAELIEMKSKILLPQQEEDVEDDGIIDDGTYHVSISSMNFLEYFPQYNDQSSNSNDHNNDTHHQDEYDPLFDPHLNW